jgi:pimeloyl-ACP methyl ester carboxylesterase
MVYDGLLGKNPCYFVSYIRIPFGYSVTQLLLSLYHHFLLSGTPDFWRKGLALAWGNPHRLSDSDVLRFQWPSIGKGWERGLVTFARSRLASSSSSSSSYSLPTLDDGQLLRAVSNIDNTTVVIVYGSKDKVVRIEGDVAKRLKKEFPTVRFVRMEGLGHDPFEEDVLVFMTELEKVLEN